MYEFIIHMASFMLGLLLYEYLKKLRYTYRIRKIIDRLYPNSNIRIIHNDITVNVEPEKTDSDLLNM